MVAAVSCGCIGATVYVVYAAVTKTDVRFVNTIILIVKPALMVISI